MRDLIKEVMEEDLPLIQELVREEARPIIKHRKEMERKMFNEAYAEFLALKKS